MTAKGVEPDTFVHVGITRLHALKVSSYGRIEEIVRFFGVSYK